MTLPGQEAVDRLIQNESRFDEFLNDPENYTTRENVVVESVPHLMTRLEDLTNAGSYTFSHNESYLSGTIGYKLKDFVNPKDSPFLAKGDNINYDLNSLQAALDKAALEGKQLITGNETYLINGVLSIPSNTDWVGNGTKINLANNSNTPVIKNKNGSLSEFLDYNISIKGVTFDCNGANQADVDSNGVWLSGIIFSGVSKLNLDIKILNSRRFAIWLVNCKNITGNPYIIHDPNLYMSTNRDGLHINKCSNINLGTLTVENGEDDALALNADDASFGGIFTSSNISGDVSNVVIDRLDLINCNQGVRLLSASHIISNISIRQINGLVKTYCLNVQDYGLGTESLYRNIKIDSINCKFDALPSGFPSMGFINIDTRHHSQWGWSGFYFNEITRNGMSSDNRPTINSCLKSTTINIDNLIENYCNCTYTLHNYSGTNGIFEIKNYVSINSFQNSLNKYRTIFFIESNLDSIKLENVKCDFINQIAYILNCTVGTVNINCLHPSNSMGALPITLENSTITNLFYSGDYISRQANAIYSLTNSSVTFDRWSPYTCTTPQRPINALQGQGTMDMSLGIPIWKKGTVWVNASGNTV